MYGKTGELNVTSKKVLELTTGKVYGSACEAARQLKLCFSHICAVARGERGSTGGYIFRYIDENNNPIKYPNSIKAKSKIIIEKVMSEYKNLI